MLCYGDGTPGVQPTPQGLARARVHGVPCEAHSQLCQLRLRLTHIYIPGVSLTHVYIPGVRLTHIYILSVRLFHIYIPVSEDSVTPRIQ